MFKKEKLKLNDLKDILEKYIKKYGDELYNQFLESKNNQKIENKQQITFNYNLDLIDIKQIDLVFIKKFVQLFFNRVDVFAKYWKSNSKSGYCFSCINEWKFGLCNKLNKGNCSNCKNKLFEHLDSKHIINHLTNDFVLGTYTIDVNSKTKFLVFDFDEDNWKDDVIALYNICTKLNLASYIEISKSSNGAHLWMFFDKKICASKIRNFAKSLLLKTIDENLKFSFKSFDRIFPTQNFISSNGLGNLVCLPYAKNNLINGGSFFVDNKYNSINPIEFIDSVIKIKEIKIDETLNNLNEQTRKILNTNINLKNKKSINIIKQNYLVFDLNELDKTIFKFLRNISCFFNPEYFKKEKLRISTYETPFIIYCFEIWNNKLYIPRGLLNKIIDKFNESYIDFKLINNYNKVNFINVQDKIVLRNNQEQTLSNLLKNNNAVLVAKTGFGKTVLALKLISIIKQKTLILVNNLVIAKQWLNAINKFLLIDSNEISFNKKELKSISIKTIQSFLNEKDVLKYTKDINILIVDECHHYGSFSYEKIIKQINSQFIYGFTATPKRYDKLDKIINYRFGDFVYAIDENKLINKNIIIKTTEFNLVSPEHLTLNDYNQFLFKDDVRNNQICNDILQFYNTDHSILVIVEWVKHLQILKEKLLKLNNDINLIVLHGDLTKTETEIELKKSNIIGKKIILATGKYIGEGFDILDIDTLFIAFPFSWHGKLEQYIGRLRINEYKKELNIIDYLDKNISYYFKMFCNRDKVYKKLGFKIQNNLNLNQVIYNLDNYKSRFNNDICNCENIISNFDFTIELKLNKIINNIKKISYDKDLIKFVIIDKTIIWIFNFETNLLFRLQNEYLIKDILDK